MTQEEIVAKAAAGDLSEEEIAKLANELTPEQKQKIAEEANKEFVKNLSSLSAIRKEKNRLESLKTEAEQEAAKVQQQAAETNSAIQSFRNEQVEKARKRFQQEMGLSNEEMAGVEEAFKRLDTGKIDADLVYKDFASAYAVVNSDELINAKRKASNLEADAARAVMNAAGSTSAPPPAEPKKEFSPEAEELAKRANITPEAAQKIIRQGLKRRY